MSVERARTGYSLAVQCAEQDAEVWPADHSDRDHTWCWLQVDAASIVLDLAAAMADRERTLQLAGVDDASSKAPRQG